MQNMVILISGGGSNMMALVAAAQKNNWADRYQARICAVISNNPDAKGLSWAKDQGLSTHVVNHKDFLLQAEPRRAFDQALQQCIDVYQPSLVLLAGFMRILTPEFVGHYHDRLINIHPSLLPTFPGLHTHERAIEAGFKFAGATVHKVTNELDHGPILAQAVVPVLPSDTGQTLAARVLTQEHIIYPQAVEQMIKQPSANV
ncbi:MAG: phosphoribosylglycinamide formyltransferase [Limnohabitans sp.]|nr:phosphoribosylglycinamide formyltransferase [Limnohabitans sp.]